MAAHRGNLQFQGMAATAPAAAVPQPATALGATAHVPLDSDVYACPERLDGDLRLGLGRERQLRRCVAVFLRVHAHPQEAANTLALGTRGAAGAEHAGEGAVLLATCGVLQEALRRGTCARRHIGWASTVIAAGRAERAVSALELGLHLVILARRLLVVSGTRRRRRWRSWSRARRRGRRPRHDRVGCLLLEAALTRAALSAEQLNVARHAPAGAPGIFHEPVVGAVRAGAVTHEQHTMVQGCAARALENATLVKLENSLVGLDGNGHRLLRHRVHQRLLIVVGHILVADDAALRHGH
mmetsp:Transcript_89822/g.231937  ORF Transcript_89822/g.231937 Transcript_89822/m.231937 type:complete len:298 (-) Transcript_89822:752-1645(-)